MTAEPERLVYVVTLAAERATDDPLRAVKIVLKRAKRLGLRCIGLPAFPAERPRPQRETLANERP
jgi:hypothetical protein